MKSKFIFVIFCLTLCTLYVGCTYTYNNTENQEDLKSIVEKTENDITSMEFNLIDNTTNLKADYKDYSVILDLEKITFNDINGDFVLVPYSIKRNNVLLKQGTTQIQFTNNKRGGMILSFDDYFDCWNNYLHYFKDYNVKATFFCKGYYGQIANFCINAQNSGMEVGYHTQDHKALSLITEEEELYTQAINPLKQYKQNYIFFDSFACPNGAYSPWQIPILLKYYKIVRLFDNTFRLCTLSDLGKERVVWSQSIDRNKFVDDNDFRNKITRRFLASIITDKVYLCTSHYFLTTPDEISSDAYTMSKENLVWLLELVNTMNLPNYCFNEIYNYIY